MKLLLLIVCEVFLLTGCLSYTQETKVIREQFHGGQYQEALDSLEKSSLKNESRSALLYKLEKAMILDRLGEKEKSRKSFFKADKLVDDLYTVSVSKSAATMVFNESAQDYSGEDYEKISIHTMLALSFLEEKSLSQAGIEARKINTKLYEITQAYDDEHKHYSEDAFARYLAGMIYEAKQQWDDAIIDYRMALKLYTSPSYKKFFQGSPPHELIESLYRLAVKRNRDDIITQLNEEFPDVVKKSDVETQNIPDFGEVAVIHELGHIAIKEAKEFIIPVGSQIVRISFPYIRNNRFSSMGPTGIELKNGNFIYASNTADMNAIAYSSLEDRRGRLLLKGAARLLIKGQLAEQARQNLGPLAEIAVNVYSAVSETADTRGWTLLPAAFYVSRIQLPAGKHTLGIKSGGKLSTFQDIIIKKGKLELVRAFSS